jgi:hypothetical protein
MKSFFGVFFTTIIALTVPALATQGDVAVGKANRLIKKFFQESLEQIQSLRGVETEAASTALPGFLELQDYGFDSTCEGEVDTIVAYRLNSCISLTDAEYQLMTVTETNQKYTVTTGHFHDKKCTKMAGKPEKLVAKKGACKNNLKARVVQTPSKKLPSGQQGVGLALYQSEKVCSTDHVSKSDIVVLQPRNRCVETDNKDFMYISCDAHSVYSYEYPSNNGSCSGVGSSTSFDRSPSHCVTASGKVSTFFCAWGQSPTTAVAPSSVPTVSPPTVPTCPNGYTYNDGLNICVMFVSTAYNQIDALTNCQNTGGTLMADSTPYRHAFLINSIGNTNTWIGLVRSGGSFVW